jgi:hypothetical protein
MSIIISIAKKHKILNLFYFFEFKMTSKQIIEDYKIGISHHEFAIFYLTELAKHVVRQLSITEHNIKLILSSPTSKCVPRMIMSL